MNLSPLPVQKFFSNIGLPLVGGKLFTYVSGTNTKVATYTDSTGLSQNTNPIILNFRGECRVWLDPQLAYKFILSGPLDTDPPTNPIWTVDDITVAPIGLDYTAVAGGTANAITLVIPRISSPTVFTRIVFKATFTNTGPTTISINGGPARNLTWQNLGLFAGGEIQANGFYEAIYDGAQWQLQGPTLDPTQIRTTEEIAAGVTPTNYAIPSHAAAGFVIPDRYATNAIPGTTVMTTALQNALAVAVEAKCAVQLSGETYKCNAGLSIDISAVRVDLNGSTIDFSSMASGHAFSFTQSEPDVNKRAGTNIAHPISNGRIIGPGAAVTGVDAFFFQDSVDNSIHNIVVKDLGVQDFAIDSVFDDGAFCVTFIHCAFIITTGTLTTYSIIQNDATNTGERQTFIGCGWFNKRYLINNLSTAGASIFLVGCSLDYFTRAVNIEGGGLVFIADCHIESNTDADYWFYVEGTNSALVVSACQIALTGNKTAFDMFYSDSTATNGGVTLRDVGCGFGANTFSTYLIGGSGKAEASNLIQANASDHPPVSTYLNTLAYGGFENANYTAEWSLTGDVPPVRSNAQAHSGSWSLAFAPVAGMNTSNAAATTPIRPGQYYQGEFWYLSTGQTGTSTTFFAQIDYLDKGGNSLGAAVIFSTTTTVAAWTRQRFKFQTAAPAGSTGARLLISMFGTGSGTPIGYIDDVVINVI